MNCGLDMLNFLISKIVLLGKEYPCPKEMLTLKFLEVSWHIVPTYSQKKNLDTLMTKQMGQIIKQSRNLNEVSGEFLILFL